VELDDLQRQIAECDENLCGTKLTPAERAVFTTRRKQAYEALHPKTRAGMAGNGRKKLRQLGEATRFTADTAEKSGRSECDVQRDTARGARID
jgi:ParB family chromosome partitioning protein